MNNPIESSVTTHIYALLDRSGSMESIAGDVVGGFNQFIKEQAEVGTDVKVTLVQFDSQDPQEVLTSGVPITEVPRLDLSTYQPRGGTPLLDATGRLIGRARQNQELRAANKLSREEVVFVTITDGEENESAEFTLQKVRDLIAQCEADGWTFVFLSAALDAYGDAERMGLKMGNIQAFDSSGHGANLAFSSLSKNLSTRRRKMASGMVDLDEDFFEDKDAEDHRRSK
jgi:Mg-chelatase subunit ChlD